MRQAILRIEETGERTVVSYVTSWGEWVNLSLTGCERGFLFERSRVLRERAERSGMTADRSKLTNHEVVMIDL